jgi:hypothetical protein
VGGTGGAGAYGIYIQANRIIAGTINASGLAGTLGNPDAGGGGGGGAILLAYGAGGYVPGAYNTDGGSATADSGAGGKGIVLNYSYAPGPQPVYLHATPNQSKSVNTTGGGPVPFPRIMPLLSANQGNESITQSGAAVWLLPNSMEASVVPIAFIGYRPGIVVNFTSSSQSGAFVNTTGQEYANQCVTGYSESCVVAYMLPPKQANFTITAAGGNSTAYAGIELR